MTKWTVVALLAVSAALVALVAWTSHSIRQSRDEIVDRFGEEASERLREVVAGVGDDVHDVQQDLLFAAHLAQTAPTLEATQRELQALVTVVKPYRRGDAFDADGRLVVSEVDTRVGRNFREAAFDRAMADSVARARQLGRGGIGISGPIEGDFTGWYRVFTTPLFRHGDQRAGCIALLVDMQPMFAPLQMLAAPSTRLLVLSSNGQPTAASHHDLAYAVADLEARRGQLPSLARMVDDMRHGRQGALRFGEAEAQHLGLPASDAVGSFVSVDLPGGRWAVATLSSTSAMRSHERALLWRVVSTSVLMAACLLALAIFVVVSARRAAAMRERVKHAEELAQVNEQNRRILDHIPVGVMTLSRNGRVTALNHALRGRVEFAIMGQPLAAAFPHASPGVLGRVRALVDHAHVSGRVQTIAGEPLKLFGDEREYRVHAVPIDGGNPDIATVVVIEDLTELSSLTNQLLRAEKLATVGVLGAGIAHEIGTPLGVIRARAEFILGKLGREHPQASGVETIVRQSDHVTRVISQLLDFSRTKPLAVRPVDVAAVAHNVADLLRFQTTKQKVEIAVQVAEATPAIAADPDQLQQVLVNLVLNAIDASRAGAAVTVRAARDDAPGSSTVRLEVVDHGCGIPEAHRHQVFDPFFTTKKRGQGTGLGLTVAAHIVRSHGGQIEIDSEPDRGTRVTLLWPTNPASEVHDDAAAPR